MVIIPGVGNWGCDRGIFLGVGDFVNLDSKLSTLNYQHLETLKPLKRYYYTYKKNLFQIIIS